MEHHILSGELTKITPNVFIDFVNHYEQKGAVGIVEACIVNVDLANIDILQVGLDMFISCMSTSVKLLKIKCNVFSFVEVNFSTSVFNINKSI